MKQTHLHLKQSFHDILKNLHIAIQPFNIQRCDERTFYLPVSLKLNNETTTFDLIYLIDRPDLCGAISLNEKYDFVQQWFLKHFQYRLLYRDEMHLAKTLTEHPSFKQALSQFTKHYPTFAQALHLK